MPTDTTAAIAALGGPEKARLAIGLRRPAHADGKWARDEQAICDLALSALDAPASAQNGRALLEAIALVVRDVAELPDRDSPDDWPEAMLVTQPELRDILESRLLASQPESAPAQDGKALLMKLREELVADESWVSDKGQKWGLARAIQAVDNWLSQPEPAAAPAPDARDDEARIAEAVRAFGDAQFNCGEWRLGDEGNYDTLSNFADQQEDALKSLMREFAARPKAVTRHTVTQPEPAAPLPEPAPKCKTCDDTGTVEKCDWPGEHANRYQEPCPDCKPAPSESAEARIAEFAARPKADEIAALRSENERLRAQHEHAVTIAANYCLERDDLRQKLAAAEADRNAVAVRVESAMRIPHFRRQ